MSKLVKNKKLNKEMISLKGNIKMYLFNFSEISLFKCKRCKPSVLLKDI